MDNTFSWKISHYIIISLILAFIIQYSIEIKTTYPLWVISIINKPFFRFYLYLSIFLIAFYYPIIAFYLLIPVIFIHLDQINLLQNKNFILNKINE